MSKSYKISLLIGVLFVIGVTIALIVCNVKKGSCCGSSNSESYISWGKSYGAPNVTKPYTGFLAPYFRPFTEGGYGACYMTQPKPGQAIPDCPYGFKALKLGRTSPYRGYWYCCAQ